MLGGGLKQLGRFVAQGNGGYAGPDKCVDQPRQALVSLES